MATYGTTAGVEAYVRHMSFDAANNPTTDQVDQWLAERSAQLTGWLASSGYAVPVVQSDAKAVLDRYANIGAAGDAELAQRSAGYAATDENKRENKFLSEFMRAEAWIAGGALVALGVPQALVGDLAAAQPAIGSITAGLPTDTTIAYRPPEWLR